MTTTNHDAAGSTDALASAAVSQPPSGAPRSTAAPYDLGTVHKGRALIQRGFTSARGAWRLSRTYEVVTSHVDVTTWAHPEHGRLYLAEVVS